MKNFHKFCLVLLLTATSLFTRAYADVTLRFWDKGECVYQTTAPVGNGQTLSTYMTTAREADLQSAGKLQACDGYSFYGWNTTSLNTEVIETTAPTISTFDVTGEDIDFYAVFRKAVTYYSKITSTSDLASGSNYLIVGENSGSYYAMGNTNITTTNILSGVEGVSISLCDNERVYNPTSTCVWQLSGSNNNWTWRNQGNTSDYLRLEAKESDYGFGSNITTYYYMINSSGIGTTISFSDEVVTIRYDQSYGLLYIFATAYNTLFFTPSTTYYGSTKTNVFMVADYNNSEPDWNPNDITKGNIYLYKQNTEYRYLSHCDPYTLRFKACGDNSCGGDFSVSPNYLTENKNTASCTGLRSFAGVNPTSKTPSIACTARWAFAGWATEPCADQTVAAPTMVSANPYVLNHNNDTLYAVYRHKTNGTPDYYSSYPNCTLWTVWFEPVNGKIGGSSSAVSVTETSAGGGVTTPAAVFDECADWSLVGWLNTPCEPKNSAPAGMKSTGTYYPQYDGERLYAVYKKGSVWTSYPLCDAATITLDAGTGLVHGATTYNMTEGSAGSGIVLNEDASFTGCSNAWTFVGWSETQISGNVTIAPTLIASGSTYYPTAVSGVVLHAVYRRGTAPNQVWSSLPDCSTFSVTLHACSDDACTNTSVEGGATYVLNEVAMGTGVEFPSATVDCSGRWAFAGWQKGSPVDYQYTLPAGLYASGATYNPSQNGESFYAVYRHVTDNYWTSSPDCTPFTIHLHACEGLFSTLKDTLSLSEENAGDGIELPAANPLCENQGWRFKGWAAGELRTTSNLGSLVLYNAGDTYYPSRNDVDLYAVYEISKYMRVTERSQLNTTDSYVIAFYWDYGAAFDYSDFAVMNQTNPNAANKLDLLPIYSYTDDNGQVYVANPADNYLWKLSANNNTTQTFKSVASNQYIYSAQNSADLYMNNSSTSYVIDFSNNRISRSSYSNNYRYWHFTRVTPGYTSFYAYQAQTKDDCYLYRFAGSSYSSWPHCAEYTVYFNGCDGVADEISKTEIDAGKGVTVPGVSQICDDWTFVGWSTEHYHEKTRTLVKDLYPQGSTFIPESNNMMLYAVYAQLTDTFDLIGNGDLRMGVNYLVVNAAGNRAMSNTNYSDNRRITSVTVSEGFANGIVSSNSSLRWRITEENDAYIFYNSAANKYLDLVTQKQGNTYYPSVQTTRNDAFTLAYPANQRFTILSNNVPSNRKKYLDGSASNNYFDSNNSAIQIRLYKQRGTYCSHPCSKPINAVRWGKDEVWVESIEISGAPTAANLSVGAITAAENGTYNIKHTAKPGNLLRIAWGGHYYTLTVPYIATPSYIPNVENYPAFDFIVGTGVTYTVTKNTHLHTLTVYDNAKLVIGGGVTLTVDTLILRSEGDNAHPVVQFGSSSSVITVNSGVIYHDRRIDYRRFYMFALPYASQMSDIRYHGLVAPSGLAAPVYFTDYFMQYYAGEQRAVDAAAGSMAGTYWTNIPTGDAPTYSIPAGKGFALGIRNPLVSEGSHDKRTLRFKMTPAADWNETENGTTNKTTIVYAQTAASDELKVHTGWNLISNPYMHNYYPGTLAENSGLLNGHWEEVNGKWVIAEDGTQNVPYMTFYDANIDDYTQVRSDNTLISPFNAAFVQVSMNDMLLFTDPLELRPRSIVARRMVKEEQKTIVNTGIVLEQTGGQTDQLGLVIGNKYTSGYDIGGDLEKKMNPNRLHTYAIMGSKLAFCALDETTAAQPIPVGVSVPQTGSYTFRFDERQYKRDDLEALWLTDYEAHESTNLLENDYTCTIYAGVHENRFALNAILKQKETPTDNAAVAANGLHVVSNADGSITICSIDRMTEMIVYDIAGRLIGKWTPNNFQWTLNLPQGVYAICIQSENNGAMLLKVCTK